ncbi:MAG TPA: zf-HC2 domain-containing protein [Accumulibacter sp.]|uniref:zf-HC2 domain-containing protein n=1 Tax=Accumulibacter sp. TaxID=2053492 RepID=UPI002BBDEE3A|nr:zf-HC2 domain-containing protein [Accumulibacter sp.]HRD89012.1 zf-HC2 domain-containing protein [Accumulibacter sp.]
MLNCREVTRLLSESQERTLGLSERMSLKVHVLICSGCRNFGKQMDALRQITRAYVKGANERHDKPDD